MKNSVSRKRRKVRTIQTGRFWSEAENAQEETHSFSEKNKKYSLLTCALQTPLRLTIDFNWKTLWSSSKRAHVDHEYAAHNPCCESFGGNAGAPFWSATIFREQDEESIPIVHPRRTNDRQLFILRHEKL